MIGMARNILYDGQGNVMKDETTQVMEVTWDETPRKTWFERIFG